MAHWEWFGHFAVRIEWGAGVLYVDPFKLRKKRADEADLVLLTNPRVGHLSPEDIDIVRGERTVVAGPVDCVRELGEPSRALGPGDSLELPGLRVLAVPAYNRELGFFPRARSWLGYVLEVEGETFYHAGATDRIPEMQGIQADVAFLPVSGRYVMDGAEAALAGKDVGARNCVGTYLAGDRYIEVLGFVTKCEPDRPRS